MKQHITENQWKELNQKQAIAWCDKFEEIHESPYLEHYLPNIGQMIEFLGDDCNGGVDEYYFDPKINTSYCFNEYISNGNVVINWKECLCDELWEAVKHKLKNLCQE